MASTLGTWSSPCLTHYSRVKQVGVHLPSSNSCCSLTWGPVLASEAHPLPGFKVPSVRVAEADSGEQQLAGTVVRTYGVLRDTRHLWVLSRFAMSLYFTCHAETWAADGLPRWTLSSPFFQVLVWSARATKQSIQR